MQTDATSSVAAQTQAGSVVALWRYPANAVTGTASIRPGQTGSQCEGDVCRYNAGDGPEQRLTRPAGNSASIQIDDHMA